MPTTGSFSYLGEDQVPDMFPFQFSMDGVDDSSLLKDDGLMGPPAVDGAVHNMFDYTSFDDDNPQQPSQIPLAAERRNLPMFSHRGSTSSSSSARSGSSNSPPTSFEATSKIGASFAGEWSGDIGGNEDNFNIESSVDFSQYLSLSADASSPPPPVASMSSPECPAPGEILQQGRPSKRRKAQNKKRTSQSTDKAETMSPTMFSPFSAQVPSSETSPTTMSYLPTPDNNLENFGDAFAMPTNWPLKAHCQLPTPLFHPHPSGSTRVPPTNYDPPNGNPRVSLSHHPFPRLVIHPMPYKSRVETQIPLKITVHNLPKGIKRVHLPTHTIAKPKLLQKPSISRNADMLELTTMLVCTSAMVDETRRKRAFERAARKPKIGDSNNSADGMEDEENLPQNGGEVRICQGCITRERKRAGRKKHKKPEEDELWDRYEKERAIVFNAQEVKEWQPVTAVMADPTGAGFINGALPEGSVQVDAPMRIACYCRHHSEKQGFQVIITLKDYKGTIIAQGISSSIMITDDHKTPGQPQTQSQPQIQHQHQQSPQAHVQPLATNGLPASSQSGISPPVTSRTTPIQPMGVQSFRPNAGDASSLPFRHIHSTPDMQGQGQNPSLNISPGPHLNGAQTISTTTTTTPRGISRHTSPTSPLSAGNRKRKASMVGKVPNALTMTKIEANQPLPPNVQNDSSVISAGSSPYLSSTAQGALNGELSNQGQQLMLNNTPQSLVTGPATPNNNGTDSFLFAGINTQSMKLERNQMFSAPVSAHPSRAPSPSQLRSDHQNLTLPQRPLDMLSAHQSPLPAILRIIPNEGSKCGGAEITVLGSNFTNDGLEVYFGSQKAITTTFWGPTSLVCMLPPSPVSGPVPVTIKSPARALTYQQPSFFNYKDDDEDQLIRIALGLLASKCGRAAADPADFARSILFSQTSPSSSNSQGSQASNNNNFSHFSLESGEAVESSLLSVLKAMDLDESPRSRLNHRRSTGQTMLHLACSLGFVRFVAGLLSRGASVHIKDKGGFTPLHMAAMNDHAEIVRRLLAKGADRNVQSHSGLTPIDVAGSRDVRQTLKYIENSSRSRSVDSRHSRASSPSPVRPFWEFPTATLTHHREFQAASFGTVTSVNGDDSSVETTAEDESDWRDIKRGGFTGWHRRSTVETHPVNEADEGPASPSATMAAIREQVATQLQQFQHTMAMHLQNLPQFQMPNMPQMPVLPSYQTYLQSAPVMQRISSLVPNIRGQRPEPASAHASNPNDSKWGVFPFFGNKDAPPAYEDIFPQKDNDVKQPLTAQAAAEFEADARCAAFIDQDMAETSSTKEVPALLQISRKHLITKEQQETLQRAHAQRLKAGSSDKMLWFVWIPILVLVLGAMLWSGAPSFVSGTASIAKAFAGFIANPRDISNRVRNIVQELP
ncbi:hypothetical protein F4802DRAFT_385956 [Xylaria palmicola]|nr:hypothetical protein F4802DRAFT_385956 [Xylaria palmicola]